MENKIAGNIAAVKYNPVTVVKKNESSHPSSDRKLTDDLKKKVKEKKMDMQKMLKFPGCSFILVLSDEVGESTKSCDCVLCFQSVQRTDLDGMIQHCKSKEHLLKVMELLNPHCADIYSKNGTEHEILSILNCRSGDLDKDGVSFAPLSTFLSVRKVIFKRILTLRKNPVKAKEDWTKTNLRKTLTPVQSPKRTPSSLSSSSVSSSPKNIGDNDCVKGVKDSSIVEGAKGSKIISLKRKSCYDNQTSPHKPEKEICTPPKNIKLAAESVTNKGTVNKDSKDATETQKLKVKIERIKDTANKKQNESAQPGSNPKVTHDDEGKKLEEKKKEIRKMLNIPGHSFILVLSDKIDEEKEVYDCVLCYQYSQRTNLEGIIQHCKSRNHLLKVLDLVNRKCAAFYSNKGTEFQIISVLKSRASELDKDGVTFAPPSTFFSVRVAIFKRILALLKNPIKDKEDWTNMIPRETLTPIKSPESEPTHPCLSSKSLSSAKDIESNVNVTALSKSKPLSKNMPLVKSESSIPKSKIAVKNSAANSELEKSNGTMPKCEKIVGNEDPNDAILNLKKKNIKMSSLPNTKSLGSSQNNNSTMESKTSTNIGDAKCSPATVVKKNESSQPYFDPKVTDDKKGKTFEEKKLEIQKVLHTPGHSFILVLNEKIDEDKKAYDCVLCHKNTQRTSLEGIIQHCKSKDHMLKVMELVNPKYAEFYSQKGSVFEIIAVLKSRSNLDKDGVSFAPTSTFLSVRRKIINRILKLRKEQKTSNEQAKTSNEQTNTSEAEDVKLKHRNIVFNEDNEDNSEDLNSNVIFDLKKLNGFEKEIYETYKNQIDELVELHRNRRPKKVIIVTDERDVFTEDEVRTNNYQYRIIKGENLSFSNLKQYLVRDPDFGSGVLYVILCGINSINEKKINPACLKTQCISPSKFLDETNYEVDLIKRALYIHRVILKFNKKDTAIFSGLLPSSPNYFNSVSYDQRKCSGIHEAAPPPQCTIKYNIEKLHLYNTFTNFHSKLFGFIPLKLDVGFSVKFSEKLNTRRVNFNFATLKNGYHFTDAFASKRKLAILEKCDKLQKKLLQSTNLGQNKEMLSKVDVNVNKDIKVDYTSRLKEATVVQATSSSQDENVNHKKETKHRLIPMTKTVIQSSKFMGTDSLNKPDCESKYQPSERVMPEAMSSRISKYDKIVVLGNSRYKYYLEQLRGPKVCVMSDDISTDDLLGYIKCNASLMPPNTLWVLVTGIGFLFFGSVYRLCSDLRCSPPLQSTQPADIVASVSKALNTFDEMKEALNNIEKNVKRVLNSESNFMLFPPIPPAMIIDSSVAHQDLHKLMVKHPKSYIVTSDIAPYFSNVFEKVSLSFARLTWSALNNMGISADPLEYYLDCQLNQIDFIESNITSPPNKLPFFSEWLNTFRDIVSSCVGDSSFVELSSERESFKSSRIVIFSDDENDKTDFESRAILSKYEKKSLSHVKSDGRSVVSSSSKNKCQYEVIDLTKESYAESSQSVAKCKSSVVKSADKVSPQIKGKTTVSEKTFVACSKPSKGTSEKSGRDPKSTLSTKKAKQSSCEPTKTEQECNIYEISADPKPSANPNYLESDVKPETLIACSEPDLKFEQNMESELNDAIEEFSDEDLYNEIFNDLADISETDSSEDTKKLSSKSAEENLNKDPSNVSASYVTAEIESKFIDKAENIQIVKDNETKQKVGEIVDKDFNRNGKTTDNQHQKLGNYQPIPKTVNSLTAAEQSSQIETNNSTFDSVEVNLTKHQSVSHTMIELPKHSLQSDTNNTSTSLVSEEVNNTEYPANLEVKDHSLQIDSNNSTLVSNDIGETEHFVVHQTSEKTDVSNFEVTKQSLQIDSNKPTLASNLVNSTEHYAACQKLSEENDISILEITEQPSHIDTNNSSLVSVDVDSTKHHAVCQTLTEKSGNSNLEGTIQFCQSDPDISSVGSEEVNKKDSQVDMPCEDKESSGMSHECSDTNDKQMLPDNESVLTETIIDPQASTSKTNDDLVSEKSKANSSSISQEISTDCSNMKSNETFSNQSFTNRKEECKKFGPIIFIANNHVNNYLKSVQIFKFDSYSFWDIDFPINWSQIDENISFLSATQSYLFIIVTDLTLLTFEAPMKECFSRTCKWPIIVHYLDNTSDILLTERLNAIRILHEKLTNIPNINTKVILTPFCPRKCLQFRSIFAVSSHGLLHKLMCNKFKPCFLDGDFDYINNKALEVKRRWFNFVHGLYCPEDLQNKISSVMFFDLHYSHSPVNWTFVSELEFPFALRSSWANKLIIVIDHYIQTYLTVTKSSNIINKPDPKLVNLNADNADKHNIENIIAEKKVDTSPNLSFTTNQNKEVLEFENTESDYEEFLISEELEREILEADDDEFEDAVAEGDTVVENETLNNNDDSQYTKINEIEMIETKESEENEYAVVVNNAENLNNEQNAKFEDPVAEGHTVVENETVNNDDDSQYIKINEIEMIETKESEENECAVVVDNAENLNNEQNAEFEDPVVEGDKTLNNDNDSQYIKINEIEMVETKESEENEYAVLVNAENLNNEQNAEFEDPVAEGDTVVENQTLNNNDDSQYIKINEIDMVEMIETKESEENKYAVVFDNAENLNNEQNAEFEDPVAEGDTVVENEILNNDDDSQCIKINEIEMIQTKESEENEYAVVFDSAENLNNEQNTEFEDQVAEGDTVVENETLNNNDDSQYSKINEIEMIETKKSEKNKYAVVVDNTENLNNEQNAKFEDPVAEVDNVVENNTLNNDDDSQYIKINEIEMIETKVSEENEYAVVVDNAENLNNEQNAEFEDQVAEGDNVVEKETLNKNDDSQYIKINEIDMIEMTETKESEKNENALVVDNAENLNNEQNIIAQVVGNTDLMSYNMNITQNSVNEVHSEIIKSKELERKAKLAVVVDCDEDLSDEQEPHESKPVEVFDKTNLINTNVNLYQNVNINVMAEIIETKESDKENEFPVVDENTANEEFPKLKSTNRISENVVEKDNNAVKDNYSINELKTSETQDDSNNKADIIKSYVTNMNENATSSSGERENENALVDTEKQVTMQEQYSDDMKKKNEEEKTPYEINSTTKENNLSGGIDRNEKNSCQVIPINNENLESTSTKKIYDKNRETLILDNNEFLIPSSGYLLQSRESFQEKTAQVGSNSSSSSKVTNIKNDDSDNVVDIKDSASLCINIDDNQIQTEDSISNTNLSSLQSQKNSEFNVSGNKSSKINSDEKFTCKEVIVSSPDDDAISESHVELETKRERVKNSDTLFSSQNVLDQKSVVATEECLNDSSHINKEGERNEGNILLDNFDAIVDDTSSQDALTKRGNSEEICFDKYLKTSEKDLCNDATDHSHTTASDTLSKFCLGEKISDILNLDKSSENYDIKVNKVHLDKGVCSDPSLNVSERLSDQLSRDIIISACFPEENFTGLRENKSPDRVLITNQDISRRSCTNLITIECDDEKILIIHPNIIFVGAENGEIFICHKQISEKCLSEVELFSRKVLTNIQASKESYNEEVKGQNLFEGLCQMPEEKMYKTKRTVENLLIKETDSILQNIDTKEFVTGQPLNLNDEEAETKNKLQNPEIAERSSTLSKNIEMDYKENNVNNELQNLDTAEPQPTPIKIIDDITNQPVELIDEETVEINHDGALLDASSEEMEWKSILDGNLKESNETGNWNVPSSIVEVIPSDTNQSNSSIEYGESLKASTNILPLEEKSPEEDMYKSMKIEENSTSLCDEDKSDLSEDIQEQLLIEEELEESLEASTNILPLEEKSPEEDMYKSMKIEENSTSLCDEDKSDLSEDIQEQLLIEEELEAEIFGDDEGCYDDDGNDNDDDDDDGKARDTLKDNIENLPKRLYSPAAAEPDIENIPTSKHAYSSLSKEKKLHSNNSDIQIESFLNNVKEVALEINNVSKDKEDLESWESTSVLENDTKISVSETKSDIITKERLNITVGHISECNISCDSIPEDKDFARKDSSQALTDVTINNDLKMDESFRKSEDSKDKHEVKMDSFDYDLLNKESDIIFDLEKASDSQSSNKWFGNSEEKNICNNEQNIENKKGLQDSLSNKIESNARVDIKSQNQNVSEIAFENLDTSNQVVQKHKIFTDVFDDSVIRIGKLENFVDSKIGIVQNLYDENKANQFEDGVAEKDFKTEETSEVKSVTFEGSTKIAEESDEKSKLNFMCGEKIVEKSNIINFKLNESVDNSGQTVQFEMNESYRENENKEMLKLNIDHIEILNDPKVMKLDDEKTNEVNFAEHVDKDEKLTVKDTLKADDELFAYQVNCSDLVVKDEVNKVSESAEEGDNPEADIKMDMEDDSLKKIVLENIVDDVVGELEENVKANLIRTDTIIDTPSDTVFDDEKSGMKDELENKTNHPIEGHHDSPIKDDLTDPFNIVKDFKSTDNTSNSYEKETEHYSNKTDVQNLSLKEISKIETLNVQNDLEENTPSHLTVFNVEKNIVKEENLQQYIGDFNVEYPQSENISVENSEVNILCNVSKKEATVSSNYKDDNNSQKIENADNTIKELCDFKIEKSELKHGKIIETEEHAILEHAPINERNLNHMKCEISEDEYPNKTIISDANNSKNIDFINLENNTNSSVISVHNVPMPNNPTNKECQFLDSKDATDSKHFHDPIPQQILIDQKMDLLLESKLENITVHCESGKKDVLEMTCDIEYDNLEEKFSHPVSKLEDKNKNENKCDLTFSNLEEVKLVDVGSTINLKEDTSEYLDQIDPNICDSKSVKCKRDFHNDYNKLDSVKDPEDSVNMNIMIDHVHEEILKSEDDIDLKKSDKPTEIKEENLEHDDKKLVVGENDTIKKRTVGEVIDKKERELTDDNVGNEMLNRSSTQNLSCRVSELVSTSVRLIDPPNVNTKVPNEMLCYVSKNEKSIYDEGKKTLGTTVQDIPIKKEKLGECDDIPCDKEKEETVNQPALKTPDYYSEKTEINESIVIKSSNYDTLNIPCTSMSNEIKSDNLPVEISSKELNNSASDLMKNDTGEFSNSLTTTTTSMDPLKLHETIKIRKDLVNQSSSYVPTPDKDSFSDLQKSELLDSDSYKQTASVNKKSELELEELNNSAGDSMKNVTSEFSNSSTTTSTSIDPLKLHETIKIRKDLVNPSSSYEPTPEKDSFSDLKNSELLDSDSYKETLASVDKKSELSGSDSYIQTLECENINISHSTNPNSDNQFSSKISDSFKNINMNSEIETLVEFDCDKKDVLNESVCSAYDPFNPTSPNVESDGTDTETESNKKVGVTHKTTVIPTVEHSSKIKIETDCDQKAEKSHKRTSKSTVEDLSKTEIKKDSNPTDFDQKADKSHKRISKSTVEDLSKTEIKTDSNPTDCDQKADKSHKRTSKSTVEDLSKTEIKTDSNPTAGKLKKMTAKSIEDHSSKSKIQPEGEKKEASYKFKILKKESENEINKSIPYVFLSDSEIEEEDSSNTNLEKGTKIENVIPRYDHIYIIGGFNPLFKKNQKLLNFTFINKLISDLNEDNVIDLLEDKGCIVANSLCIFICDIIDIMKSRVETKSISSKSKGNDFIVHELKDSSSNTTEEGKLFITKSITSFIRIVDRLRNKLPVVVMPLQPYMLTVQFNFAMNESGPDDSRLFIHGSSYKWTHYRDHFVNDWMRILDKNDKKISETYIEPFITKPPFVYPIRNAELKGIGIKRRKLEWTLKVNEVILKLVKAEFKMKSKITDDSIKKEDYTTAECSKDKFCEPEICEIKITNLSESVPNQFYEEMSRKATKQAVCRFEEGYVEITFDSHLKGHLFANYLNNIAIGDTILKTTFIDRDCKKGIPKLDETKRRNFRDSLRPLFEFWEFSASQIVKKNIRHTLSCESYKTIECEESECDEASCIFYHSEMDRRRNPYSVPYGSTACKYISTVGTCNLGDKCLFAHNDYECMFHPFEIYFKLCKDRQTRKQCFSSKQLCPHAHLDSPETFFTKYWIDSLLFGTPLAVDFLVGAISKFNLVNPAYKDTRIFMMGASISFLNNVRKAVKQICRIHALKHDFVGERDVVFECEPLLFGTPSNFLKRIGHLVVLPFTLIIVSQVDVLLSIRKERKALINFFARCQMPFSPPYVQTLFVADEYDADMQVKIKHYLSKNVKVIKNPEHKVKFDHDVPCTPFALNALPKWLDTGSNPSQVYPFLSAEVAESVVEGNKKKLANSPWFRREEFYSSNSSEFSDSSELTSSDTEDDRRSNRRGRKRKTSSSRYRSTSPSHKRYCSRSPSIRRSTSRCSSTKPVKRPRSRQSYSPTISSCELVPYNRSSSSSLSPERFPKKKKGRTDEEYNKEIYNYSPPRRNLTVRDTQYLSNRSPSKRRSEVRDIKYRKSAVEEIQERSSRSPPKKRANIHDVKVQSIKPYQSPQPPPLPPKVPSGSKLEGKDKKELTKPDLSMDRIVHRSILLESSIQSFNTASLREELGDDLYEEFEAAREEIVFKLEEEFDVYKTMPNLYDKYEECYEGFMQMYKIKYPNHSEEHKEKLWKEFWKSKFDFVEKTELRNRMVNLIGRFKEKIQSVPPAPPPPNISGKDSLFKQCKSEIKMSSTSHVSTASGSSVGSAPRSSRLSDVYFNPTPVPPSNSLTSTSRLSSYSNPLFVPQPSSNVSNLQQRYGADHINNSAEGKVEFRQSPLPPPPPIISDRSSQITYNKGYYSNESSGFQTRTPFRNSSSNSTRVDLYSKPSEGNLDNRFIPFDPPTMPEPDHKSVSDADQQHSLIRNLLGKLLPPSDFEEVDRIVSKSSFHSSKGGSVDSSKRETPSFEKTTTPLPPISVESLPAHIMALAKGLSSDTKNKSVNEVSNISPIPSSSFNTSSVTSGSMHGFDNQTKENSPAKSSITTSSHAKGNKERIMKETKRSKVTEDEKSLQKFSMDKAITDLESMVPYIGALSSSIKYIIKTAKEDGINSEKSLRTFVDDDNITLMKLALMKIKGMEGKKEFYSSLERSVNGLIKYAKDELEKEEKRDIPINFEAVAKATVGKDSSSILKMIRIAALYEGVELTKQQENESYMKVCSIHFNLATN